MENFGEAGFNFPISYKGKLGLLASYGDLEYEYYQNDDFKVLKVWYDLVKV